MFRYQRLGIDSFVRRSLLLRFSLFPPEDSHVLEMYPVLRDHPLNSLKLHAIPNLRDPFSLIDPVSVSYVDIVQSRPVEIRKKRSGRRLRPPLPDRGNSGIATWRYCWQREYRNSNMTLRLTWGIEESQQRGIDRITTWRYVRQRE